MPGLNVTAHNAKLDANAAVWPPDTVGLHTADPGNGTTANAGEVTGGSPAYARQSVTWAAAATLSKASSAQVQWNVPGGGTAIGWLSYWRGATYLGSRALDAVQTFATQGTYTIAAGGITEGETG